MSDATAWIGALRNSHERVTALLRPLTLNEVQAQSYADEWSIAEVASHLGSQAEIFVMFLEAGLGGAPAPGNEAFGPIWARWNALMPLEQVNQSLSANETLVTRLERIPATEQAAFALSMFGMDLDLSGLAALRLAEHAVHTWDIEVALDPAARLTTDAVDLLIDIIPATAGRAGKGVARLEPTTIETREPKRRFLLTIDSDSVAMAPDAGAEVDAVLTVPAEALIRLVYGRLDAARTPAGVEGEETLAQLRNVFTGI